jgi:nitrogen fixation/metabolism regulation signal transduction histidine kinase
MVTSTEFFNEIFGAINSIGAILDKNRQVVYANNEFMAAMGFDSLESLLGKRPGEAISCIHSTEERYGCGTAEACSVCGAVNAILESQIAQKKVTKETRITSSINGLDKSWDLKVTSSPITFSDEHFYVFTVEDISDEKRRLSLERIFFHDILNIAGGLNGLLTVLKAGTDPEEARDLIDQSEEASRNLIEEIMLQRQIVAAENGDLIVNPENVRTREFLYSVVNKIKFHEAAAGKTIIIDKKSVDLDFSSDRILLQRVIINLLKNALEATPAGGTLTIGCKFESSKLTFYVCNSGVMPKDVQLQIFQRSFSTKGKGRGIGTYSIKLLSEKYLNGKVSFVSNEAEGTRFNLEFDV